MFEETGNTGRDPSKKMRGDYQLLDTSSEREELTASDDRHENESCSRDKEEETQDTRDSAVQAVLDKVKKKSTHSVVEEQTLTSCP